MAIMQLLTTTPYHQAKRKVGIFVSPCAREKIIKMRSGDFIAEKLKPVLLLARQLELSRQSVEEIISEIYGGEDVR